MIFERSKHYPGRSTRELTQGIIRYPQRKAKIIQGGIFYYSSSIIQSFLHQLRNCNLFLYDFVGNINFNAGWTDITFDTQPLIGSFFSHSPGFAEIIFLIGGWYRITFFFTSEMTAWIDRTTFLVKMQVDIGAGYGDIPGSFEGKWHRVAGETKVNIGGSFIKEFNQNDKIKLLANKTEGTSTLRTFAGGVGILINKII